MYTITVNKITINCSNEKELKRKIALYCGGSYDMHNKLYNEALQTKGKALSLEEEKYVKSDELITDLENAKELFINKRNKKIKK
jgi:hypothetical protein